MSFDWTRILESKRALRRDLATRPLAEKLRIMDALRERQLALRNSATPATAPTPPESARDDRAS